MSKAYLPPHVQRAIVNNTRLSDREINAMDKNQRLAFQWFRRVNAVRLGDDVAGRDFVESAVRRLWSVSNGSELYGGCQDCLISQRHRGRCNRCNIE